jgi:hypothetical protein
MSGGAINDNKRVRQAERVSGEVCRCGRVRLSFVDEREADCGQDEPQVCERCGGLVPVVVVRVGELATWRVVV